MYSEKLKLHHANPYADIFSLPSCPGVLKGVPSVVLGVCESWCFGVTPEKSLSIKGVFKPPFKGVSTLVSAMMFCASCNEENVIQS